MEKIIGIDLGTTNSVVAVMEAGKPVVIANSEGARTTPSVVAFDAKGDRLVGAVARRQAALNPEATISSVKRFIGRNHREVPSESKNVSYKVSAGQNDAVRISIPASPNGRQAKDYAPEEISALVLRKLVADAEAYLGEKVKKAVITVPAYFNDAQRQATKDAGKIAGLEVMRVVNEPTAAALAYGMEKKEHETVLVFDLGGGTFDVSILDVGDGVCEVKATHGDTHLGGDDFDRAIVDWMAGEFQREHGVDLRREGQALQRLTEAAEKAKCELSSAQSTTINLPFITSNGQTPLHLKLELNRAKFDSLTRSLVERTRKPVEQALADARVKAGDIDEVILVGGSTRIPAVQEMVRSLVGGRSLNQSVNPDEVVAVGAAVQAGVLAGDVKDVLLLDVTPLSLGVETLGGVMTKLIDRNTTIPAKRTEVFSTAEGNQPAVDIVVLQGEREMARDNRRLGNFRLEGIRPAPRGLPQIEVTFDIDANGILSASARDKDTGKEQKITISGSTNLDQGEVDRMVREAETHAADDKKARSEVDARNELDGTAYTVERIVGDLSDALPAHEKARAEQLVADARTAVKEQAPIDRVRSLKGELDQLLSSLANHQRAAAGAGGPGATADPGGAYGGAGMGGDAYAHSGAGQSGSNGNDDDVIDAEFSTN